MSIPDAASAGLSRCSKRNVGRLYQYGSPPHDFVPGFGGKRWESRLAQWPCPLDLALCSWGAPYRSPIFPRGNNVATHRGCAIADWLGGLSHHLSWLAAVGRDSIAFISFTQYSVRRSAAAPGWLMLSTKEIFLIASLLCFVTYLVLFSFRENGLKGIRQLLLASVLGMAGNMLYAYGRELAPVFAFEVADAIYASASLAVLVGYRHLFRRTTMVRPLVAVLVVFTLFISFFHHVIDSFTARTALASGLQATVALFIARTVVSAGAEWREARYPKLFILSMCGLVALGHLTRVAWQLSGAGSPSSLLEPSGWNVLILAAGSFALPVMAFGALLIAHRRIVLMAEDAANHDFLTGAWTRRAFFQIGEHELLRAARTRRPVSVLLVDLDNFKLVNDTYGHDVGDRVLTSFVTDVKQELRSMDSLCRLGGDEFAVLMPETDLPGARALANRLQTKVHLSREQMAGVTLSIGVATLRENDSLKMLIKRADVALYAAKESGRNRVFAEHDFPVKVVSHRAA